MSKTPTIREQIHMAMLAKSESAKDCGELTVVPLGFAVSIAQALIFQSVIDELNNLGFDKELRDNPILYCGGDEPIPIDERIKELKTLANKGGES